MAISIALRHRRADARRLNGRIDWRRAPTMLETYMIDRWQARLRSLQIEAYALSLACRDPRVPWYAKLLAACVLAYAASPIDLIPDFLPLVGHLDDLIVVPAGLALVIRLVPKDVLEDCRARAGDAIDRRHALGWIGAAIVVVVWMTLLLLVAWGVALAFTRSRPPAP